MGVCESVNNSDITQSNGKNKVISSKNKNTYSKINRNNNYFNTLIKGNSINFNPNNTSASQSLLTLGNTINGHPFLPPQMHIYNSKSFQTSIMNGSSLTNGNSIVKGSKLNSNSLSMSRSCGEIIIDGQINPEMKGEKDFQKFIDTNNGDIDDVKDNENIISHNNDEGKNKKDINLYHRTSKNLNNANKNGKNKQRKIIV